MDAFPHLVAITGNEPFQRAPPPDVLAKAVLANDAFRRVLYTPRDGTLHRMQLVAMHVKKNASIGKERHNDTTQTFTIFKGSGMALFGEQLIPVGVGAHWVIEPGVLHDLVTTTSDVHVLVTYSPPKHHRNTVQLA